MADESFFGGLQSGLQDLLPNKITYATPEQLKAIRGAGEEMYRAPSHGGVYTWGNAFGDVAQKIMGAMLMNKAGELEKGGLEKGAAALTSSTPSGGEETSSSSGGASPSAPQSASSGQSESAPIAPVTNAADISSRLETGSTDPTKSMANISPDTNGSKSYGSYGLNSQPGYSAHSFTRDYGPQLGLTATPGTPEYDAQWLNSVKNNPIAHRAAEVDWYNKNIVSGLPAKLEKIGVDRNIASDPRVTAYFADRSVQQGSGSITGAKHAARIQAAYQTAGGDPVKFLKAMSLADRTPEALQADFPHAIKSGVYGQKGHDNRVMGREALSLGLPMPTPGATPSPGAAPSPAAIAPMVNAIAGTPTAGAQPSGVAGASIVPANVSPEPRNLGAPGAPGNLQQMLTALGSPSPSMSPTGAIGGAPPIPAAAPIAPPVAPAGGAPGAPPAGPGAPGPAAMTQAIAGLQAPAGGGGARIPPSLPMSSLPSDAQIQNLMKSNIPQYVERGKELAEYKQKLLTPQQVTTPDGSIYVGTPYTGYSKLGLQGMPTFIKTPIEAGGVKTEQYSTLGAAPGGGPAMVPVPTIQPPGAPTPAPGGGAPGGGLPPMPPASNVAALADWGTQATAARKAAEATAEETAKGAAKPMIEAMEKASTSPELIRKLDIMSNAYKQAGISGGPLGEIFQDVRGVAAQLGLIDPKDKTLTAQNIIEKISTQLAFQATKDLTNRPAAMELQAQMRATPGLKMSNQSAIYMIDIMRQSANQDREIAKIAMAPGMTPSRFVELRDKFYEANPIISPFTHLPINAPGGGIPGTKKGPQSGTSQPPPPEAIRDLAANPTPERIATFEKHFTLPAGSAAAMIRSQAPQAQPRAPTQPPAEESMMLPGP